MGHPATAILAVVGRHLPEPLRTFLLTLASVIAVGYTAGLNFAALAAAAAGLPSGPTCSTAGAGP